MKTLAQNVMLSDDLVRKVHAEASTEPEPFYEDCHSITEHNTLICRSQPSTTAKR